jgi:hypothetical protein
MTIEGERLMRVETKLEDINIKLDKFIDSAESRFASKLTERVVYGMVTLILVAVTSKLLNYW